MNKNEVFAALSERGATTAEVSYSGGNDEGGCEGGIVLKDNEGSIVKELDEYRPGEDDADLVTALCEPVYDRWGSFAGDFSVMGTLTWTDGKAIFDYEESEYVNHHETADLALVTGLKLFLSEHPEVASISATAAEIYDDEGGYPLTVYSTAYDANGEELWTAWKADRNDYPYSEPVEKYMVDKESVVRVFNTDRAREESKTLTRAEIEEM